MPSGGDLQVLLEEGSDMVEKAMQLLIFLGTHRALAAGTHIADCPAASEERAGPQRGC